MSRVDQDRFQVNLAASQASNEELGRTNEELCRNLQNVGERTVDERAPPMPVRARPMSFSQVIMDTVIPATFMGPKGHLPRCRGPRGPYHNFSHTDDAFIRLRRRAL